LSPTRTKCWLLVVALVASLAIGTSTQPAGAVIGDCTPGANWGTPRQDLAPRVLELVNEHRSSMGLTTLVTSQSLTNSSLWKSRHMAFLGYMAHDDPAPPVARTTGDRLSACGYPATRSGWGENIAWGYSSPESVMQGWLTSPGHKANIEMPSARSIGIGVAVDSVGRIFWTQAFGTVVDSGTPATTVVTTRPSTTTTPTTTAAPTTTVVTTRPSTTTTPTTTAAPTTTVATTQPPTSTKPTNGSVSPSSATIFAGHVTSGSIPSLADSDQSAVNLTAIDGVVQWYSLFTNIPRQPSSLRVTYGASATAPCQQSLWIWSWTRGVWVMLDARTATTTESVTTVSVPGSTTEFVTDSSNGGAVAVLAACVRTNTAFSTSTDFWHVAYS
jgi:uncharacterized protein YkwD